MTCLFAEVVESLNAIQTQRLEEGSVDRVVDCCTEQLETLQCILKQGGICRAADYPATTGQCIPNKCRPFARVRTCYLYSTASDCVLVHENCTTERSQRRHDGQLDSELDSIRWHRRKQHFVSSLSKW